MIIIDTREFNSSLPSYLYHSGFLIEKQMLTTADYILSNAIGIERKQIRTNDFYESLKSNRLGKQLEKMSQSFNRIYLLIEFTKDIDFEQR